MFGIDDALIWGPLVGAAIGALTKKKDPLTGALMGAAVGYGGAALPGLLGGAGAAAEGAGAAAATEGAAASGVAQSAPVVGGNVVGTSLGQLGAKEGLLSQAKPYLDAAGNVGKAASAANSVKGLLAPQEAPPAPQPMPNKPLDLSSVIGSNNQAIADQLQQDQQRKQLMSQFAQYAMGGRNYG